MTPQRAKELLPIITAFAEGKTIQIYDKQDNTWYSVLIDDFSSPAHHYRIKPTPILAKAFLRKNGELDIDIEVNWVGIQSHQNFWKWVSEPFEITETSC